MQPTQTHAEVNDRPPRRRLRDLELPPEVAAAVREACTKHGWYSKIARQQTEDDAKLQHFFGGQDVAYMSTPEGLVIIAAGRMDSDEFRQALAALSREERCRVVLDFPRPRHDEVSQLFGASSNDD